ncbi:MAG: hypothetical protein PUB51_04435, partial [Oscillospiraceae bacterium]|nr:hypothetical protein [Oscillospiraceae bacterium]
QYASSITFDKNVMNVIDWGCTMTCWFNPAGQLIIQDSRDMYYVCENRRDAATPAPSEEPTPAPSEEPTPAPSEEPVKAAHPYVGTYDLYAWCLYDFTSYTEVKDSKYIITDNTLEYTIGGVSQGVWDIKVEPHTADDTADHVISLKNAAGEDVWYVKTQEDGTILMYDTALYIFYYVRPLS